MYQNAIYTCISWYSKICWFPVKICWCQRNSWCVTWFIYNRKSHRSRSVKKGVLKSSTKFTESFPQKSNSGTGVFLWILWNYFMEYLWRLHQNITINKLWILPKSVLKDIATTSLLLPHFSSDFILKCVQSDCTRQ